MVQSASTRAIGVAAAAVAGVAVVGDGVARGAPLFTENPGHAQPAVRATGATDNPYGWFGVNNAKTWEVYRKFTGNGHPNPSPTPDPALEPRITNEPGNHVKATVHNQTAATPWWNGSGLWFGPAGNSTPADYQLLISHPYTIDPSNGQRVTYNGPMDIRVGFMETANAGAAVNQDNGDGRVGNYSLADFYEGPVGADVVSMYVGLGAPSVDAGGSIDSAVGFARAATSANSEGSATRVDVTGTGVTGVGPYPVSSRIFRDATNGLATFELKFGGWTGTFQVPSLTEDQGGTDEPPTAFEGGAFDFDPANPARLTPVTYLNASGDTAGVEQMMDTYMTIRGDANLDGRVNGTDFALLAGNFGRTERGWREGDFNQDGAVNGSDFALLAGSFGRSVPGVPPGLIEANDWAALEAYGVSIGVPVPEPAALPVLAAALGILARRRRRA